MALCTHARTLGDATREKIANGSARAAVANARG